MLPLIEKNIEMPWQLQAKIYEDQPYVFMYSPKRKIVIHKRFDNANMYYEKPGFVLHNFNLKESFKTKVQCPKNLIIC